MHQFVTPRVRNTHARADVSWTEKRRRVRLVEPNRRHRHAVLVVVWRKAVSRSAVVAVGVAIDRPRPVSAHHERGVVLSVAAELRRPAGLDRLVERDTVRPPVVFLPASEQPAAEDEQEQGEDGQSSHDAGDHCRAEASAVVSAVAAVAGRSVPARSSVPVQSVARPVERRRRRYDIACKQFTNNQYYEN